MSDFVIGSIIREQGDLTEPQVRPLQVISSIQNSELTFERLIEMETNLIGWLEIICAACNCTRVVNTKGILEKLGMEIGATSGSWKEV